MRNIILQQQRESLTPIPGPVIGVPWTSQILISAGFSTPEEWGVSRPRPIKAVVAHTLEGYLPGAIAHWNTGVASAHLVVLRDGRVVLTVKLENISWHAGSDNVIGRTQFWKTHNINPYSIGIECEGFAATGISEAQVQSLIKVGRWITARYGVLPEHTVDQIDGWHRHSEISNQRSDPGDLFPLERILIAIRG